jgi:short-subunit dehydrogenase
MDARAVARAAVRGLLRGKFLIIPGLWYKANALAVRVLPRGTASALAGWIVRDRS